MADYIVRKTYINPQGYTIIVIGKITNRTAVENLKRAFPEWIFKEVK